MIRLIVTYKSYAAIRAMLINGWSVNEPQEPVDGHVALWLSKPLAHALARLRVPGQSYSDVLLQLADAEKELR